MTKSIPEIIQEYLAKGDATGWFEELYSRADKNNTTPPWAGMEADSYFVKWAEKNSLKGDNRTAIVIGCGLGDDAEYLSELGFKVTAFDVSSTAIEICKKRFPGSSVSYQQADLFQVPQVWHDGFDFVFENRTIQALPVEMEQQSKQEVANLVADNGQLLILCHGREPHEAKQGIPWALSHEDLSFFIEQDMTEKTFEEYNDGRFRRFLALYQK
ncbi:MAG: class I SAM-dependent methyltransferase [Chloroflexota bacterium]